METFDLKMIPGYSYVKPTEFKDLFDIEDALKKGTLFKALYLPIDVYGKRVTYHEWYKQ